MTTPDYDALADLTLAELDEGSRLLGADLVGAVATRGERWAGGVAVAAFLLLRRADPTVTLEACRAMTLTEIVTALAPLRPPTPPAEDDDPASLAADPTAPAPV